MIAWIKARTAFILVVALLAAPLYAFALSVTAAGLAAGGAALVAADTAADSGSNV